MNRKQRKLREIRWRNQVNELCLQMKREGRFSDYRIDKNGIVHTLPFVGTPQNITVTIVS